MFSLTRCVWPVKIVMVELSESNEVINVFYDINLILHTVTSIHNIISFFLKMIVFYSVNLTLFIVNSIHSIQKKDKQYPETWKQDGS